MRRFAVLLLGFAAGCSGSSSTQPDKAQKDVPESKPPAIEIKPNHDYTGWSTIIPNEAGFEVRFPKEPTVNTTIPRQSGSVHLIAIRRLEADQLGFVCSWALLKKAYESRVSEESYLLGAQAADSRSPMSRLITERAIVLGGVPGRAYTIELSPGNMKRCRIYLAGKRVISLQVAGKDQDALQSKDALKFLDSLKIEK